MKVVRVLTGANSSGAEPDLPLFFVHLIDATHHPITFGNLVFHFTSLSIVKIKMVPAVSLRHPDNLMRFVEVLHKLFVGVIDESLAVLIHNCARLPSGRVHSHNAQYLM